MLRSVLRINGAEIEILAARGALEVDTVVFFAELPGGKGVGADALLAQCRRTDTSQHAGALAAVVTVTEFLEAYQARARLW